MKAKMAAAVDVVSFILGVVCLEMIVIVDEEIFKLGGLRLTNIREQRNR
jgi:hypothetical protein